jgi:hypothetical protein
MLYNTIDEPMTYEFVFGHGCTIESAFTWGFVFTNKYKPDLGIYKPDKLSVPIELRIIFKEDKDYFKLVEDLQLMIHNRINNTRIIKINELIFNFTNASDIEAIKVLNILAEVIIGEMR